MSNAIPTAMVCRPGGDLMDLLNPAAEDIRIDDVIATLSKLCRFGGRGREFYSVAEHSVRVAEKMEPMGAAWGLAGLMHDAAEAYWGDIPRPQKAILRVLDGDELRTIKEMESKILTILMREEYALDWAHYAESAALHDADNRMLMTEAVDLLRPELDREHWPAVEPYPDIEIEYWDPERAAYEFRACRNRLERELAAERGDVNAMHL